MRFATKILFFTIFVAILYFAVGLVTNKISSLLNSFNLGANVIYILHRLKICTAVNIFISELIATWIINKIINYWGS